MDESVIERGVPPAQPRSRSQPLEEGIEIRRYLDAFRRSRWLMLLIVAVITGGVLAASLSLPDKYRSTASIVKRPTATLTESVDVGAVQRELATIDALVKTSRVLNRAASQVPGETGGTIAGKVSSSVDPEANLIFLTAEDRDPRRAAAVADAVATTFVNEQRRLASSQYEGAREALETELERVIREGGSQPEQAALRQRISELGVAAASAGTDLQIAERASVPSAPASPRPLRNTVLAAALGLFLAVLVALARDQLTPRARSARELSRLLELQVLAVVPYVRGRVGRRRRRPLTGPEYEAYQTLAASIRFAAPRDVHHVILVTSALHGEGKTTAVARLGQALAAAGHDTLMVSGDLRWPTLHTILDTLAEPGVSELLADIESGVDDLGARLESSIVDLGGRQRRGELHLLPSGARPPDAARALATDAAMRLFEQIRRLDYAYVLVDAAPLLGIADTRALAQACDNVLFVARLDRLTLDNVMDARDALDRVNRSTLGLFVVGGRGESSPYYVNVRAPVPDEA